MSETLAAGIGELKKAGFSAEAVQQALDHLSVELVFTAHPSEAKRRSIRAKLRRMRHPLEELDRDDLLPRERRQHEASMQGRAGRALANRVLAARPAHRAGRGRAWAVDDAAACGKSCRWSIIPCERSLAENYPGHAFQVPVFLRFGSWMGGDRDGNPHVTAEVTAQHALPVAQRRDRTGIC